MKSILLLLLLLGAGAANAQISATRYIDADGVEVIQNRSAAVPVAASPKAPPVPVAHARKVNKDELLYDAKFNVSATEQAQRDRDRVAILQQELDTESRKYEAAYKRVQDSAAGNKPSADEAKRMTEDLYDHQKNIQALNTELRRARHTR
jgi:hypothetical protein